MPSMSICLDFGQTFLAWEPHFCPDCREASIGVLPSEENFNCRSLHSAIVTSLQIVFYPSQSANARNGDLKVALFCRESY